MLCSCKEEPDGFFCPGRDMRLIRLFSIPSTMETLPVVCVCVFECVWVVWYVCMWCGVCGMLCVVCFVCGVVCGMVYVCPYRDQKSTLTIFLILSTPYFLEKGDQAGAGAH